MTRAVRGYVAAALLATLTACGGGSGDVPTSDTGAVGSSRVDPGETHEAETVDRAIAKVLDDILPDGANGSLVAARDGRLVHCAGFGVADHEDRVPATCDTAYDIGSITKQFTAAAILKLEMTGDLNVGDLISDYLGPVPADKRAITVHQLLTHTAGLVEALGDDYQPLSRQDMIARAFGSRLASPPGAEYHYSNLGYSLLAAIVEEASGVGYEEFLAEHLFAPAGMTSTGYLLPDWPPAQVAVEYDAHGIPQGRPFEHPWATDGPYWNLRGNGGLLSTPRDMFRWHLALEGDQILDRQAKDRLFTPHVREEPDGETSYGYGWTIQESPYGTIAVHDGGNTWSYGVLVRLLDHDLLVFYLTNQNRNQDSRSNLSRLSSTLVSGIIEELLHN
ncbi:MAG: serine hydrolase domain-containing protein [Angustibacter sp.]